MNQGCKRHKGDSGQALVEFALAFPLQLLIVFGIMQLAFLAVSTLVVNYTAYRCARSAVIGGHHFDPATAGRYVNTNSGAMGDYYRDIDRVAQLMLAPLTGPAVNANATYPPKVTVPGRGEVQNSDIAAYKTRVVINDPGDDDPNYSGPDLVTATVEFNQQLAFPFIDGLFRMVCRDVTDGQTLKYVFGELDEEFQGNHFGSISTSDSGRGRIRIIGGKVHYVITRSCTLYKGMAMEIE